MLGFTNLEDFHNHVKEYENGYKLDLSSSEDLSIALMNLISIEEHLYFTSQKTSNPAYLEVLSGVRQIRKQMQGELIHDPEGEVWCICKHLLAATMRLTETATKVYAVDKARAQKFYEGAGELYNLFWALNLKLIKGQQPVAKPISQTKRTDTTPVTEPKITPVTLKAPRVVAAKKKPSSNQVVEAAPTGATAGCKWKKFSQALNENLDCCHE